MLTSSFSSATTGSSAFAVLVDSACRSTIGKAVPEATTRGFGVGVGTGVGAGVGSGSPGRRDGRRAPSAAGGGSRLRPPCAWPAVARGGAAAGRGGSGAAGAVRRGRASAIRRQARAETADEGE